jgi:hypothetical protein
MVEKVCYYDQSEFVGLFDPARFRPVGLLVALSIPHRLCVFLLPSQRVWATIAGYSVTNRPLLSCLASDAYAYPVTSNLARKESASIVRLIPFVVRPTI